MEYRVLTNNQDERCILVSFTPLGERGVVHFENIKSLSNFIRERNLNVTISDFRCDDMMFNQFKLKQA